MKKGFSVFAILFFISLFCAGCGSDSQTDDTTTDTGDTVTDEDSADTGPTDTEPSGDTEPAEDPEPSDTIPEETDNDISDTIPENNDDTDTTTDTEPVSDDDADTVPDDPDSDAPVITECVPGHFICGSIGGQEYSYYCKENDQEKYETCREGCNASTGKCNIWKDPDTGLTWTSLKYYKDDGSSGLAWDESLAYCSDLEEGGYTDWHLPNIDELRSLVQNCPGSELGGACKASEENGCLDKDECYSMGDCFSCSSDKEKTGKYSKLNDAFEYWFWSSSTRTDYEDAAWVVEFYAAYIFYAKKTHDYMYVRCVR